MLIDYLGRGDWLAASRRWQLLRQEHARTLDMVGRGERPDTLRRQVAVANRELSLAPTVAAETGAARAVGLSEWLGTRGKERVIARSDFEPSAFLEIGLAIGRAVCLVELKDRLGRSILRGSGFLVAPGVMMTNHHVLMSEDEALLATITLDFRNDPYGRPTPTTVFKLRPSTLFVTDAYYDCSVVAVGEHVSGNAPVQGFGWLPLAGAEGKVEVGDPINIIQHPSGEPMQWVIRDNRLLSLPELASQRDPAVFAHYEADTKPGSSGAPALSRLWEVFALHHQAVPAADEAGNVLGLDGKPYAGEDDAKVKWLGNEGIRVSALVRMLTQRRASLSGDAAVAMDGVLRATRPDYIALAISARRDATRVLRQGVVMEEQKMSGGIEFTLPLKISISLGGLSGLAPQIAVVNRDGKGIPDVAKGDADQTPDVPNAGNSSDLPPALRRERDEAPKELENSRTRVYLDRQKSDSDSAAYYQDVRLSAGLDQNFHSLAQLVSGTHSTQPRYAPAKQLYPWVELHKDGRRLSIKSIYSGMVFDAREFIDEAFAIDARREALKESMRSSGMLHTASEAVIEGLLEDTAPYNCEHSVPQSWFGKKEPMRGDMHHLFACESKCNSFRGNHAYFDFPDDEATMDQCGRRQEDEFEPISGKGAVARATMYFLVRYPESIDLEISQMSKDRIDILKRWHEGDPVSDWERHRNQAIFEVQGNRNPFIDNPEWAERLDLSLGLGT